MINENILKLKHNLLNVVLRDQGSKMASALDAALSNLISHAEFGSPLDETLTYSSEQLHDQEILRQARMI